MSEKLPDYDIVISEKTLSNILSYKKDIENGTAIAGERLKKYLPATTTEQFIEALLATKQPRIFAESEILADGTDWTHRELGLLGDINISMTVNVFDNGAWNTTDRHFRLQNPPLPACSLPPVHCWALARGSTGYRPTMPKSQQMTRLSRQNTTN